MQGLNATPFLVPLSLLPQLLFKISFPILLKLLVLAAFKTFLFVLLFIGFTAIGVNIVYCVFILAGIRRNSWLYFSPTVADS